MAEHFSIPPWKHAELPEPQPLSWRHWTRFIGPGIVMMGIQIGGGEWLQGPLVTAKYGGALMWIATVAILGQVFYNIEVGRYALYCGEPIFTGFMRLWPGATFWFSFILLLNTAALLPGLTAHAAAVITAMILNRPPTSEDAWLVTPLSFACLTAVALPVLIGGKVYNMLQWVMTAKVIVVLLFCLVIGVTCVSPANWWNVFSGFGKFGNVPVSDSHGEEAIANVFTHRWQTGEWPIMSFASIVAIGAFAGYAGGGGLSNSTYSNFIRDKGWGMGSEVGAIPSAIGGKQVSLSHVGKVFPLNSDNMRRWRGWWRYLLTDQLIVWAPGCFMGMALPALLSMQFSQYSTISDADLGVAQSVISADGLRHAGFHPLLSQGLWLMALFTGLVVLMPSQMSIVDDISRRWTDAIWTASPRIRKTMNPHQVKYIYYSILAAYMVWSFAASWLFNHVPTVMTNFIANMSNLAIGLTSFLVLWVNHTLLPKELRPRLYQSIGLLLCGLFYLGLTTLIFWTKVLPLWTENV